MNINSSMSSGLFFIFIKYGASSPNNKRHLIIRLLFLCLCKQECECDSTHPCEESALVAKESALAVKAWTFH